MTDTSTSPRTKNLRDALAMVQSSDLIALDLETTGLDPRGGTIRLAQISNGEETYIIDLWKVSESKAIFQALSKKIILAHGGDFEWRWVYHHYGIDLENIKDTMLLSQLVAAGDMSISNSLGNVSERELGIELDKVMQKADWTIDPLTKRHLDYAAKDAKVLFSIYRRLITDIIDLGLEQVAEIENRALPSFARMKLEGMPIDHEGWLIETAKVGEQLKALEQKMLELDEMPEPEPIPQEWALKGDDCVAMLHAAGLHGVKGSTAKDLKNYQGHRLVDALLEHRKKGSIVTKEEVLEIAAGLGAVKSSKPALPWNFGSPAQVKEIIYELTGDWVESTDEATLLKYVGRHPFFEYQLEHRTLKKRLSTYGVNWFKSAYDEERQRVHPGWRQIGTSTGRVACREPNAQNLPGSYRRFFVAPEGRMLVNLEYSQIEVRIIAKTFNVRGLLEVFANQQDVYKMTAAGILGIEVEEVSRGQRQLAKAILLGMLYGLSAKGLPEYAWKNYGIKDMSQADAEAHVDAFYDLYPEIEEYHRNTLEALKKYETVNKRTMAGRLRAGITVRNEALNAPIQGTAADGLKLGMAYTHERLREFGGSAFIVSTIHDELLLECDEGDAQKVYTTVEKAMLEAMNEIVNAEGEPVPITTDGITTKVWTKG